MSKFTEPCHSAPDLSEFDAISPKAQHACWFRKLDPDQQAKAQAAREAGYSLLTIAKVVTSWGVKVGSSSAGDHFRGVCSCGDAA